jgi:hypothetical protein
MEKDQATACMCGYVCVGMYVWGCMCGDVCVGMYVWVCMCVHLSDDIPGLCIYDVYVYIYMYIYAYECAGE